MRIACVLIPRFPLAIELLEQPALRGRPVVIGGAPEERKLVLECSPEVERAGIRRGMPLREARALYREATFLEAHHGLYRERFNHMLDALDRASPMVEGSSLGCAYVGLDGLTSGDRVASPLFDGEHELASFILGEVQAAVRLKPRIGIAESRFAAWAAATIAPAGTARSLQPVEAAAFLAPLPITLLPLSEESQRRLRWLGLRRIGSLAALPREAVAEQFGPEGATAWDLAHGEGGSPLVPRRQLVEVRGQITFSWPVTEIQAIIATAKHLLVRLLRRPESIGRAVRGLTLSLLLRNSHRWEHTFTFREPISDGARMLRALVAKLDGLALPHAAEALALVLRDLCAEIGIQGNLLLARGRQRRRLEATLEQLHARFGRQLVMTIAEVEPWSRLPERRYALVPMLAS